MSKEISVQMRKMHELVRANYLLQNHQNPDVAFAMSDVLVKKHTATRVRLSRELGLPRGKDKREAAIQGIKEGLMQEGIPYWVNLDAPVAQR